MEVFHTKFPVIGMIHLLPLPGSPGFTDIHTVVQQAQEDYNALKKGGIDGIIIENYGDTPYFKDTVELYTISWMKKIALSLNCDIPFGVNVLRNDCKAAVAIAHAAGGKFIRCNILSGVMVTDQGIIEGKASEVLRYRNVLDDIKIFADVLVKHATPLKDQSIEQAARDTVYRGRADALIVTGSHTGEEPSLTDLKAVKKAVPDTFLFAGSGVTLKNVESILEYADGCIVGTALKKDGKTENPVDEKRVKTLMNHVEALR